MPVPHQTTSGQDLVPINVSALREIRSKRGWSQYQLARVSRISRSYISDIEGERKVPRYLVAQALADALGVTVTDIAAN